MSAQFFDAGGLASWNSSQGCTLTHADGCEIAECQLDGGIPDASGLVGAGNITMFVSGGDGGRDVPRTGTSYLLASTDLFFDGGETVTAVATGEADGGVPGFNATALAPLHLELVDPPLDGGQVTIPRSSAFAVSWAAGSGEAVVTVFASDGSQRAVKAVCSVSGTTGTFTLPPSVTGLFEAGMIGYLQLGSRSTTEIDVGRFAIRLVVIDTHSPLSIRVL